MGTVTTTLYEVNSNGILQVTSVPDISLLESLGLRTGTQIVILNRYSLGGPVLLRVEGAYSIALGKDIAQQVSVREVTAS